MAGFWLGVATFIIVGQSVLQCAIAAEQSTTDVLLSECVQSLGSKQDQAVSALEKLKALQSTFTQAQDETFHKCSATSLGIRGLHQERVALVQSFLGRVKAPAKRAEFLYQLIDGNTALGKYESALISMNEAILLLPLLKEEEREKIPVLQAAAVLLDSLHAYDEALEYAERIYALRGDERYSLAACLGLTDKVELNFLRGNRQLARSLVDDAVLACNGNKRPLFSLMVKTDAAIDLIDSGEYVIGINAGLPLLHQFSVLSPGSDYVAQLQETLARAYLKTGNLERAEHFGLQAYQRAQSGKVLELQEKTSETIAVIKRAQGQFASAIEYYDINLTLKKKVLDDQLQKNLAYQRVKFDTQDKANQMSFLEQKNKNLRMERALQEGRYQNLILLMTLGLVVLSILGAWLVRTLKQKNVFRVSSQVDGLTQVSNRAHFTACAQKAFKNTKISVSLVLFDMDLFKKINDTYGHAVGDWVLKNVCATARTHLRKADAIGRLGGEEFALLLPMCTEEEARALAERCRVAIAAIDTQPSGFHFSISGSFGVATRVMGEAGSFEKTLVAADKALYLSKNEGRNRVTVFQHSST